MLNHEIACLSALGLTCASGIAATAIVAFGDTRKNASQRFVAEKFAQIAFIGAAAIIALLDLQA